jgi:hypothetical protein
MTRKLIPLFADTHAGHRLGLMNPMAQIWDTSVNPPELTTVPEPNAWQELMWEDYNRCIQSVKELAGEDEVIPYHDGDITQGSKYPSHLVAHSIKNQAMIAHWNMIPWLEEIPQVKQFNFIAGTPSHIGFEGSALMNMYDTITKDYPDVKFGLSHHAVHSIEGEDLLDIAHHGPQKGTRVWLAGNQLRYYLKSIFLSATTMGEQPPRVVIRAHYHTPQEETITENLNGEFFKITGIILPSFSGVNGYARQYTRSVSHVTNGICCLEFINGRFVDAHWFTKTRDVRSYERI